MEPHPGQSESISTGSVARQELASVAGRSQLLGYRTPIFRSHHSVVSETVEQVKIDKIDKIGDFDSGVIVVRSDR